MWSSRAPVVPANARCLKEEGGAASMCSVLWLLIQLASELLAGSPFDQTWKYSTERYEEECFDYHPASCLPCSPWLAPALTLSQRYDFDTASCSCFLTRSSPHSPPHGSPSYCNSHFSLCAEPSPLHGGGRKLLMLLLGFDTMLTSLKPRSGLCNASCTHCQRTMCCVFLLMACLSHSIRELALFLD